MLSIDDESGVTVNICAIRMTTCVLVDVDPSSLEEMTRLSVRVELFTIPAFGVKRRPIRTGWDGDSAIESCINLNSAPKYVIPVLVNAFEPSICTLAIYIRAEPALPT